MNVTLEQLLEIEGKLAETEQKYELDKQRWEDAEYQLKQDLNDKSSKGTDLTKQMDKVKAEFETKIQELQLLNEDNSQSTMERLEEVE
jgi:hypothetical protein